MTTATGEKVIDFNSFRQQRTQPSTQDAIQYKPMLVWCPMWVMVPEQALAPHPES